MPKSKRDRALAKLKRSKTYQEAADAVPGVSVDLVAKWALEEGVAPGELIDLDTATLRSHVTRQAAAMAPGLMARLQLREQQLFGLMQEDKGSLKYDQAWLAVVQKLLDRGIGKSVTPVVMAIDQTGGGEAPESPDAWRQAARSTLGPQFAHTIDVTPEGDRDAFDGDFEAAGVELVGAASTASSKRGRR